MEAYMIFIHHQIVSVERVQEYQALTPEAPLHIPETDLPEDWPVRGEVKYENYSTRYRDDLDLVLRVCYQRRATYSPD